MIDKEENAKKEKQSSISIFFEEVRQSSLIVPILAIISGLLIGGLIVALSTEEVYTVWSESPVQAISNGFKAAWEAYTTLFTGSFGTPSKIIAAIQSGDGLAIRRAFNPVFESLVKSIPYIFAGLAVSLGFRTGLFNIGVEGQIFMGGIFSVWVGYSFTGLPAFIHIPFAFMAGALGGALWGFIPGLLKAKTGGHEVINTIMMNYVAFRLTDWLLREPMKREGSTNPLSPIIEGSAELPRFFDDPIRFHLGFFIALAVAALVYWFLFKTKWGFDLRTVGANPHAARYAGMNIVRSTIAAMSLSGALAGMAGANELLGLNHHLSQSFPPQPLTRTPTSASLGSFKRKMVRMIAGAAIKARISACITDIMSIGIPAAACIRVAPLRRVPKSNAASTTPTG